MTEKMFELIERLERENSLSLEEYKYLIDNRDEESACLLREKADKARRKVYGNKVFIRGLIEISNICKNDCLYCGIRKGNKSCQRYRLSEEDILTCCKEGYGLGFRTFVMQGGEDGFFTDEVMCSIIRKIKKSYPDCAVTLSLGERSEESYRRLFEAGADRYLLRHETADKEHYGKLHPKELSFENRMECLRNLKKIGFQTGCGFMVESPFQTSEQLAKDLKFVEEFSPEMCGIGPFIPHNETVFRDEKAGSCELTCYLLSIVRLIKPTILLPSTTALGTIDKEGREKGILSGGNVVMPNLSPLSVRKKYMLYEGKISTDEEAAENLMRLKEKIRAIGFEVVTDRGDFIKV